MEQDPTNASVAERVDLTDALSIVKIRPDSGTVPSFRAGQFFRLGLPQTDATGAVAVRKSGRVRYTKRAYSVASSPNETGQAEFFVVRIEEGVLTPRLWEIEVGGRLWMDSAAKGEFTIDAAPPGRDLIMVSTGTGIAPFISMLRTYRGQPRWRKLVLIQGVRHATDFGYTDELTAAAREDDSIVFIPLATREPADSPWTGLRGRVQKALEPATYEQHVGAPLDPAQCHVFLCGNPTMIDTVEAQLTQQGFVTDTHQQKGNIHFERYW